MITSGSFVIHNYAIRGQVNVFSGFVYNMDINNKLLVGSNLKLKCISVRIQSLGRITPGDFGCRNIGYDIFGSEILNVVDAAQIVCGGCGNLCSAVGPTAVIINSGTDPIAIGSRPCFRPRFICSFYKSLNCQRNIRLGLINGKFRRCHRSAVIYAVIGITSLVYAFDFECVVCIGTENHAKTIFILALTLPIRRVLCICGIIRDTYIISICILCSYCYINFFSIKIVLSDLDCNRSIILEIFFVQCTVVIKRYINYGRCIIIHKTIRRRIGNVASLIDHLCVYDIVVVSIKGYGGSCSPSGVFQILYRIERHSDIAYIIRHIFDAAIACCICVRFIFSSNSNCLCGIKESVICAEGNSV